MRNILLWIQVVVSLLLIAVILLQQKGTGLSSAFGGSFGGQVYRSKRGLEKMLLWATILLAVIFALTAVISLLIS